MTDANTPLFVDLDGTLLNSDMLLESLVCLLRRNPAYLLLLPWWLLKGRAHLKAQIADRVSVRVDLLPYNKQFLEFLQQEKDAGRTLILLSASTQRLVSQIAEHLPLFDQAIGSTAADNLKGGAKLRKIQALVGDRPFNYAGNDKSDLAVWDRSEHAVVVNASAALSAELAQHSPVARNFPPAPGHGRALLRALRPHQWLKNGLLFLPLLLAHKFSDLPSFIFVVHAFIAFCLCASSVYLLNDLLDLEADRQHESKSLRPFAAGELSIAWGLSLSPLLLLTAFFIALTVGLEFTLVLACYYLLTLLYNFGLKSLVIVDVLVLAALYTLRIIAGAAAIHVLPTFWLLAFSMFLFMSLAIVKRVTELDNLRALSRDQAAGRGYVAADLGVLSMLGITSGFISVLVFALYINAEDTRVLYGTPEILWFICPLLLYLVSRIWLLAHRGQLHEDPLVFAATDRRSQFVVVLCALLVWAAIGQWFS